MRILHTSDWHLGRALHGRDLLWAQEMVLDSIVDMARSEQVDAVLIAGDVFDHTQPAAHIVQLLGETLRRLGELCQVVLISGNHDSAQRLGFTAPLLRVGVNIHTSEAQVGQAVELAGKDGHLGALLYPIPYLHPLKANTVLATYQDQAGRVVPDEKAQRAPEALLESAQSSDAFILSQDDARAYRLPATHEAVFGAALRRISRDLHRRQQGGQLPAPGAAISSANGPAGLPVIGMAHVFLAGAAPSDSETDIAVGGLDYVSTQTVAAMGGQMDREMGREIGTEMGGQNPEDLPSSSDIAFSYLALGHIHRPQRITVPGMECAYAGAILPYSFSEAGAKKSVRIVDFSTPQPRTQTLDLPQPYRLERVVATMEQIESGQFDHLAPAWCEVTLSDAHRPTQALQRVERHLPNVLSFPAPTAARGAVGLGREKNGPPRALSALEVTQNFWAFITGSAPGGEETALLEQLIAQAREGEQ